MKAILTTLASLSLLVIAAPALAQQNRQFGVRGTAVISAERLFGFHTTTLAQQQTGNAPDLETTNTGFGFGWNVQTSIPFTVPRAAFDYFVINHLSVGAAIGFAGSTVSNSANPDNSLSSTQFLFSPRVGYAYMFNDIIGIWPRGGVTFHTLSTTAKVRTGNVTTERRSGEDGFALSLEVPFVLTPVPHLAFTFAPTFDVDVGGTRNVEDGPYYRNRYRTFGLHLGMLGWF